MLNRELSRSTQVFLALASLLIVGFGQPAWSPWLGLMAAGVGYALFFRVLLCHQRRDVRFTIAMAWFAGVQCIQLFWLLSHPYVYIYPLYVLFSAAIGAQFGVLAIFITPDRIKSLKGILCLSGLWVICEWMRLFLLAGYTWNPIGLALTGSSYALQMANVWGVFGLSFWVMLVNFLFLRAWITNWRSSYAASFVLLAAVPYLYGFIHLQIHREAFLEQNQILNTVLVQTAFSVEETANLKEKKQTVHFALNEWKQILQALKKQRGLPVDLIVMPEYAVRCGTYSCVYPYEAIRAVLLENLKTDHPDTFLPPLETPWARSLLLPSGQETFVNNAFVAQSIANYFNSGVIVGLEDANDTAEGLREYYTAAVYFKPHELAPLGRYEKRVLMPLGEYIPFEFCRSMAKFYGVYGSFIPGKAAKDFEANHVPFGVSICYEETFGNLMRENKRCGAQLLINMTNDAWYPHSLLPQQHFWHALLRTVENGFPLIRSTNVGMTGAVDSFGRTIAFLGDEKPQAEWLFDSIRIPVPVYHYQTLYSYVGDYLIIGLSFLLLIIFFAL